MPKKLELLVLYPLDQSSRTKSVCGWFYVSVGRRVIPRSGCGGERVALQRLEAACLVRPQSLMVRFDADHFLLFDGEGRWIDAFKAGTLYKRGMDGRVLQKQRGVRRWLSPEERTLLHETIWQSADKALSAYRAGGLTVRAITPDSGALFSLDDVEAWLKRCIAYEPQRLLEEEQRFREIYTPIPILPPDDYNAFIVQATQGCSYNRCTFCNFYRGESFRVKEGSIFQAHVQRALAFHGKGMARRRWIFLGDGDALMVPQTQLLDYFDILHALLPIAPTTLSEKERVAWAQQVPGRMIGIDAFMDTFRVAFKQVSEWEMLRQRGLNRVYLGVESGYDPLRHFLNKPGSADQVMEMIYRLKAAGVHVGLIFMVGVGGDLFAEGHYTASVQLVRRLALDRQDHLYLSPFYPQAGTPYVSIAEKEGIRSWEERRVQAELQRFYHGFAAVTAAPVSVYDLEEFIYQ